MPTSQSLVKTDRDNEVNKVPYTVSGTQEALQHPGEAPVPPGTGAEVS